MPEPLQLETEPADIELHEVCDAHCDNCGNDVPSCDARDIGGRTVCDDCVADDYVTCDDCADLGRREDASCIYGDRWRCDACDENYFTCDGCGRRLHNDDYDGDGYCTSCAESNEDDSNIASNHRAKPPMERRGIGPHYLGVELEVEAPGCDADYHAGTVLDLLGRDFVICKHDGSLDNGFEIVTGPASLDFHRQRWERFFARRPKALRSFNTCTCGLHIHASRQPLTDLAVGKILAFVNARANYPFVRRIAQRELATWCKVNDDKRLSDATRRNPDRYEAVNLQNRATIEFRIFKGTLKRESVYRAMEFVDALVQFSLPARHGIREFIGIDPFCAHVEANAKRWPHLASFVSAFRTLEDERDDTI